MALYNSCSLLHVWGLFSDKIGAVMMECLLFLFFYYGMFWFCIFFSKLVNTIFPFLELFSLLLKQCLTEFCEENATYVHHLEIKFFLFRIFC